MVERELGSTLSEEGAAEEALEEAGSTVPAPAGRVVIERVEPEVDGGRYPIKRVVGESVVVVAYAFADGHDEMTCVLLNRPAEREAGGEAPPQEWEQVPMRPTGNDRWQGEFRTLALGRHLYTVEAWVDHFHTWSRDLVRRLEAGQDVTVELQIGAQLVAAAASRASGDEALQLRHMARALTTPEGEHTALSDELRTLMARNPDRQQATRYPRQLEVVVDRPLARCGAWYELFPRSAAGQPGRHGTFRDVEARLPYVAEMGFDVLYMPPIHPIGRAFRKGRNNAIEARTGDPGSPWAIGAAEGGHTDVHPELGTLEDFRHLRRTAERHGLEIALDLAFQASPDHPWVREHREWFRDRPDGTVQYAENPPKKYQDIYPLDFEGEGWRTLWQELLRVTNFWLDQGVRIFRVDNPHTKPFAFWEWIIREVRQHHPDVIFLSEAFTRPHVMYQLARLGFNQSYTYFAWRNGGLELREYLTELTRTEVAEYFRPNLWVNTQDILTEFLQTGGQAASALRYLLAATLGASYGVFGPVFELVEVTPLVAGREEYLNSEKYEVRHWDLSGPPLKPLITRVNAIRRAHPALQQNRRLRFLRTDNERLLAYAKVSEDGVDVVVVVVNLDPHNKQTGWLEVPLAPRAGFPPYRVIDLLNGDSRYTWRSDSWNYVELDPARTPGHIMQIPRPLAPEPPIAG